MANFFDQYNTMPDVAQPVHLTQAPPAPAQKQSSGGVGGFLKRMGSSLAAPATYFAKTDIIDPFRETAAQVTGNKQAYQNAVQSSARNIGLGDKNDLGQAVKHIAGNGAELATNLLIPEAKATLGARVIQGAKIGAAGGAGSAMANDKDVFTGAVEGAVTGGGANGILGKFVKGKPGGTAKAASENNVLKDIATEGQQMQGRGLGLSAGNTKDGREIFPQDTEKMLNTFKNEGIKLRGANSMSRDVVDKMKEHGQQIADHFETNNHPLTPDDTQVIADNFMNKVTATETDPRVIKEYQVLADNLQKGVKDTKSLWEYRKNLDSRIPKNQQGTGVTLSNQTRAIKDMRSYVADELGHVPGVKNYHDLSEIKNFIGLGSHEQNQPANSLWGHILSSTPVQRLEQIIGQGAEKGAKALGGKAETPVLPEAAQGAAQEFAPTAKTEPKNILDKVLTKRGIPVKYESDTLAGTSVPVTKKVTLTDPKVADIEQEVAKLKDGGFNVEQQLGKTPGSLTAGNVERGLMPDFTPIQASEKRSAVALTGKKTAIPLQQQGDVERGIIHTPDEYKTEIPDNVLQDASAATKLEPPQAVDTMKPNILQKLSSGVKATAMNSRVPTESAAGAAEAMANPPDNPQPAPSLNEPDLTSPSNQATDGQDHQQGQSPIDQRTLLALVTADPKNATTYLALYNALKPPAGSKPLNATQQGQANNAGSALQDIQSLHEMLAKDPSLTVKGALPGGSITQRLAGTTDYEAARANIKDVIGRMRSGAAITASEERTYNSMLPAPGDTAASANKKLQRLSELLGRFADPQGTSGSDGSDLLANSGQ